MPKLNPSPTALTGEDTRIFLLAHPTKPNGLSFVRYDAKTMSYVSVGEAVFTDPKWKERAFETAKRKQLKFFI
jgi:hypothetical protein